MSVKGKQFGHVADWRKRNRAELERKQRQKAAEFQALPQHERLRILLGLSEVHRR